MAYDTWVTFRLETDGEGTQTLSVIQGGQHRGGVTEGRMSWTGGLSIERARLLGDMMVTKATTILLGSEHQALSF
jgi:hypothetical protein